MARGPGRQVPDRGAGPHPVEVDYGCEFRYRDPIVDDGRSLVVAITQSGETADTLAALREAKRRARGPGHLQRRRQHRRPARPTAASTRTPGPEIGVASTKAFTSQLVALLCWRCTWPPRASAVQAERRSPRSTRCCEMPDPVEQTLEAGDVEEIARASTDADFLYLGRGVNYPIALEGALKLKEISYIHAEGYPAGEMKHGPIALIDENMPVVALAPTTRSSRRCWRTSRRSRRAAAR